MTRDEIVPPTPEWFARHRGKYAVDRDVHGKFVGAARVDTTVLAWLLRREALDETHAYHAMVLMDLRRHFRRKTDYRSNALYALEFFGGAGTGELDAVYLRVCRRLAGPTERRVTHAIEAEADPGHPLVRLAKALEASVAADRVDEATLSALVAEQATYRDAFDRLVTAIQDARKEVEKVK